MKPDSSYRVGNVSGRSNVVSGSGRISNKRTSWRFGNVDLGLGGMVSIGAVLLVGGGGAAAVVNEATKPSAAIQKAAGTWRLAAPKKVDAITISSLTLNITAAAVYQATVQTRPAGKSTLTMSCAGEVSARGDALVLKPFDNAAGDGPRCVTFTATISDETMTLGYGEASAELHRS
jgi:hypothetical protein